MKFKSERDFIASLRRRVHRRPRRLIAGIGDDAAVLNMRSGEEWCITTDLLVEGIHFDLHYDSAHSVGHKSLTAGLSDIAAMGARARFALVSIAVPSSKAEPFLSGFYRGFLPLARKCGVTLIGGDTSRSERDCFVDVIVMGQSLQPSIRRSGARVGDLIFVTGTLGQAAWGLHLLRNSPLAKTRAEKSAIQAHLHPTAQTEAGLWLGKNRLASAMIDVSDGLSTDLHHLCRESGVGARVEERKIPVAPMPSRKQALRYALTGGEDYQLLFTVHPANLHRVRGRISKLGLSEIGRIVSREAGVLLISPGGRSKKLPISGWDHFREGIR
ncbi:MAG: thiamine-phosphate kinase [Acidobacteriia bacterium]|nr:thiamine-phosphate kinase [Terriglobia bacterium]